MIYTDFGTHIKKLDYCPLALLNGLEWGTERKNQKDRFYNLYYFKKAKLSWFLFNIGVLFSYCFNFNKIRNN